MVKLGHKEIAEHVHGQVTTSRTSSHSPSPLCDMPVLLQKYATIVRKIRIIALLYLKNKQNPQGH